MRPSSAWSGPFAKRREGIGGEFSAQDGQVTLRFEFAQVLQECRLVTRGRSRRYDWRWGRHRYPEHLDTVCFRKRQDLAEVVVVHLLHHERLALEIRQLAVGPSPFEGAGREFVTVPLEPVYVRRVLERHGIAAKEAGVALGEQIAEAVAVHQEVREPRQHAVQPVCPGVRTGEQRGDFVPVREAADEDLVADLAERVRAVGNDQHLRDVAGGELPRQQQVGLGRAAGRNRIVARGGRAVGEGARDQAGTGHRVAHDLDVRRGVALDPGARRVLVLHQPAGRQQRAARKVDRDDHGDGPSGRAERGAAGRVRTGSR